MAEASRTNPPLQVSTVLQGDAAILHLVGDVDLTGSPTLRNELRKGIADAGATRVVVDLTRVPYMDSSGVATLVEAMQLTRKGGKKLVICSLTPRVQSIFQIAKLNMVFTIVSDLDAALKA